VPPSQAAGSPVSRSPSAMSGTSRRMRRSLTLARREVQSSRRGVDGGCTTLFGRLAGGHFDAVTFPVTVSPHPPGVDGRGGIPYAHAA
jgi:hypothetical protein